MNKTADRIHSGITGVGKYFPERVVTNHDLAKIVDTNDEWITERTGIKTRHFAEPGTPASDLALPASRDALAMAGVDAEDVDCIIVATVTPDTIFPSTACNLQHKLGAKNAWAFDLSGACSGWIYAMTVADGLIRAGTHHNVLVVGVDVMTSILNMEDRNTCVLFGDGAGATLFQRMPDGEEGVLETILGADGGGGKYLYMPAGGSAKPPSHETVDNHEHSVIQDGRQVFRAAVEGMANVSKAVLDKAGCTGADIALFVPHQANLRIIDFARRKCDMPEEKVMVTIDRFGNTTAATIPTSLHIAMEEKRLQKGDLVLISTFGAGFTWGATVLRWALD